MIKNVGFVFVDEARQEGTDMLVSSSRTFKQRTAFPPTTVHLVYLSEFNQYVPVID